MEDNGTFECSNDIMNRVYRNAWWGISSNYKGVPLDCPQRDERQPWLGDHAMGTWGESFMFNNGNTYAKWEMCIRDRSMGWKVCLWARLLDGDHAYKLITDQLTLVRTRRKKEELILICLMPIHLFRLTVDVYKRQIQFYGA